MKKIVFIFSLVLSTLYCNAQYTKHMFAKKPLINLENFDKQRIHFGFYLGLNQYDFKIDKKYDNLDILVDSQTGFNVGLISNLRLHNNIDLRFEPGLSYGQRNLRFPNIKDPIESLRQVKSTYIHFPLLLKLSANRTGNIKPYVLGGVSGAINLTSNFDSKDDNKANRFRLNQRTYNYELGAGIDIYFEYFKFSPSIRGVFGLNNEMIPDNDPNSQWTGNVAKMSTRGVFINFAFH